MIGGAGLSLCCCPLWTQFVPPAIIAQDADLRVCLESTTLRQFCRTVKLIACKDVQDLFGVAQLAARASARELSSAKTITRHRTRCKHRVELVLVVIGGRAGNSPISTDEQASDMVTPGACRTDWHVEAPNHPSAAKETRCGKIPAPRFEDLEFYS